MSSKIDSAILKALALDAESASISSHGGSGFSSTFKIQAKNSDGFEKLYFVKTGKGKDSEIMFAGRLMTTDILRHSNTGISIIIILPSS